MKRETLSDSEENEETFKSPNEQVIMDSIKTLNEIIQMRPSFGKKLKSLLQIRKQAKKYRHNKQN